MYTLNSSTVAKDNAVDHIYRFVRAQTNWKNIEQTGWYFAALGWCALRTASTWHQFNICEMLSCSKCNALLTVNACMATCGTRCRNLFTIDLKQSLHLDQPAHVSQTQSKLLL